jgi:flagellar assembly factor FliW
MTRAVDSSADLCAVIAFGDEPAGPARPSRAIESRRFGRLEITERETLTMTAGLLGFEEYRAYCIAAPEALHPLMFLVACDDPEVTFPVLPARMCLAEYAPTLPGDALEAIGAEAGAPLELLAVCALAQDTMTLHANLRGPVVINPITRRACQVVLHDSAYSLRHLLSAG